MIDVSYRGVSKRKGRRRGDGRDKNCCFKSNHYDNNSIRGIEENRVLTREKSERNEWGNLT